MSTRTHITDPSAPRGLRLDEDAPDPNPAPDEAVVAVHAFGVNRGELMAMTVRNRGWHPGRDLAGVVISAAADGSGPPAGSRVLAIVDDGSWSDRLAVPTSRLAEIPEQVATTDAAALPTAGLTAVRALREGGPLLGRQVLVTAATGGVGQFATQLARAAGADVTALVSRPESREIAEAAGAHRAVTDLADGPGGYRLVLDGAGGDVLRRVLPHLAPYGVVAAYGALAGPTTLSFGDLHATTNPRIIGFVHSEPADRRGADLALLADLVNHGTVVPRVGLIDDWSRLHDAVGAVAGNTIRGRVVMTLET